MDRVYNLEDVSQQSTKVETSASLTFPIASIERSNQVSIYPIGFTWQPHDLPIGPPVIWVNVSPFTLRTYLGND